MRRARRVAAWLVVLGGRAAGARRPRRPSSTTSSSPTRRTRRAPSTAGRSSSWTAASSRTGRWGATRLADRADPRLRRARLRLRPARPAARAPAPRLRRRPRRLRLHRAARAVRRSPAGRTSCRRSCAASGSSARSSSGTRWARRSRSSSAGGSTVRGVVLVDGDALARRRPGRLAAGRRDRAVPHRRVPDRRRLGPGDPARASTTRTGRSSRTSSEAEVDAWRRPLPRRGRRAARSGSIVGGGVPGFTLGAAAHGFRLRALVAAGAPTDEVDPLEHGREAARALRAPIDVLPRGGHLTPLTLPRELAAADRAVRSAEVDYALEQRDGLDVRRVREHVDRPRARRAGSRARRARYLTSDGERRRVARDVDDPRRLDPAEPAERLAGEAGARRVDDDDVRVSRRARAARRPTGRRCRRRRRRWRRRSARRSRSRTRPPPRRSRRPRPSARCGASTSPSVPMPQ